MLMASSIRMCMAYSYACNDKYINIMNEAKQAKAEGEGNVLTDRGDEQARAVSYSATKRSHR